MSLDVYLRYPDSTHDTEGKIFVRLHGQTKQISRAEWDSLFPDREPVIVFFSTPDAVYSENITHNLGRMAKEAGIYEALWRPEEIGITTARQLIAPLSDGLGLLQSDPDRFKQFNPSNGWGTYEALLQFTANYLAACYSHLDAIVEVSR